MNPLSFPTFNASDAISVAWRHFSRQWVPWVVSLLLIGVIMVVLTLVSGVVLVSTATSEPQTSMYSTTPEVKFSGAGIAAVLLSVLVVIVVGIVYQVNCYRNAYRMTQGETIAVGDFFKFSGVGTPILVSILCGLIISIGFLLILPGIAAAIVLMYVVIVAAINPSATVGSAFSEGFKAFKNNAGQSILLALLLYLINLVGEAVVVGGLVAVPLMLIASVVGYLMATGRNLVVPN